VIIFYFFRFTEQIQHECSLRVYYNPVTGKSFMLGKNKSAAGLYQLRLLNEEGRAVQANGFTPADNMLLQSIVISNKLSSGISTASKCIG